MGGSDVAPRPYLKPGGAPLLSTIGVLRGAQKEMNVHVTIIRNTRAARSWRKNAKSRLKPRRGSSSSTSRIVSNA